MSPLIMKMSFATLESLKTKFKKVFFYTILVAYSSACSVIVTHPQKGESPFDSHSPTKNMSRPLANDLKACRINIEEQLIKSGLKIYRNQNAAIKECLRRKGWSFHP